MSQEITSIIVEGYKGIPGRIELQPSGSLIVLAGANGSGKSSIIDAVAEIFDPKGTRLTSKPINETADEARVELTTTEARLVRVWKKNDAGTLSAYALDGAKYPSGKDFILKASGGAVFDTKVFAEYDDKKQRDELLALVELPFDPDKLTAQSKAAYEGRTEKTRDVKRLTAQLAGFAPLDPTLPAVEVSAGALLAEAAEINDRNAARDRLFDQAASLQSQRERAEDAFIRAGKEMEAATEAAEEHAAKIQALPQNREDTAAISEQLANVEQTNAKIRAQAARVETAAELAHRTAEQDALTATIDQVDKAKRDGLAAAVFPIAGLSVDDTGITFNRIPFKQINSAAQIIIAFDLFTAAKPDIRIIFIKNGDLLDSESVAGIRKIADERGYLVLMERDRDESRQIGFTIDAGQVVSA